MKVKLLPFLFILLCCWESMGVAAEEAGSKTTDPKNETKGAVSFGLSGSKGNSDSLSIDGSFELRHTQQQWLHSVAGELEYSKSGGEVYTRRLEGHYSLGYVLGEGKYLFNLASYETDKPGGTAWRLSDIGGYGISLLEGETYSIDGMFGLGFRKTNYTDSSEATVSEAIGHAGIMSEFQLTDTTTLSNTLVLQPGKEDDYSEMSTALSVDMTDKISLQLKHAIKHNTNPPESVKKTDSRVGVNISVDF